MLVIIGCHGYFFRITVVDMDVVETIMRLSDKYFKVIVIMDYFVLSISKSHDFLFMKIISIHDMICKTSIRFRVAHKRR